MRLTVKVILQNINVGDLYVVTWDSHTVICQGYLNKNSFKMLFLVLWHWNMVAGELSPLPQWTSK